MPKIDLSSLPRNDLVKLAKGYGIEGSHRAKSAYLIETLEGMMSDNGAAGSAVVAGSSATKPADFGDNEDKIVPTPTKKVAATKIRGDKTSQSFSGFTFVLLAIVVALLASSSYLFMQLKIAIEKTGELTEEIDLYEAMVEEMGNEKNSLIREIDLFKEKKEEAEKAYEKYKIAYEKLKKKCASDGPVDDFKVDTKDMPKPDDEDNKVENIYCWFDDLFGSSFFEGSCTEPAKKKFERKCPFKSVDHAIAQLKTRPEWTKLQSADRYSKDRKKLIKELSKTLHPDKLIALGCPKEYGDAVMKLVNSMRTERTPKVPNE